MTNSSGYYGSWGGQTTPTSPYWQNLYDEKAEWGPCYYDVTHCSPPTQSMICRSGEAANTAAAEQAADAVLVTGQLSGIYRPIRRFPLTISAGDASGTQSRGARGKLHRARNVFGTQNSPSGRLPVV